MARALGVREGGPSAFLLRADDLGEDLPLLLLPLVVLPSSALEPLPSLELLVVVSALADGPSGEGGKSGGTGGVGKGEEGTGAQNRECVNGEWSQGGRGRGKKLAAIGGAVSGGGIR